MNLIPQNNDGSYLLITSKGVDLTYSRFSSKEEAIQESHRRKQYVISTIDGQYKIHESNDSIYILQGPICLYHFWILHDI